MPTVNKHNVSDNRADLSRFVIHLTRDDVPHELDELLDVTPQSACKKLLSILKGKRIEASNPHCVHGKRLNELPQGARNSFNVVCLTEVPLEQIHLLTREIEGRKVKMQPYGLVFERSFIIQSGGQPAIYLNNYHGNRYMRDAANELFNLCKQEGSQHTATRLLPLINTMQESYDFAWEREWRMVGDLHFKHEDIVAIILPNEGEDDFKHAAAARCIPVISPGWTYEQVVSELSRQLRPGQALLQEQIKQLEKSAS